MLAAPPPGRPGGESLCYVGVSQNDGYLFGGPHNKDYSILGTILGSPYFGKLPCIYIWRHTYTVCIELDIYMYIYIYVYMYLYLYTCRHMDMHTDTYIDGYAYMHIHALNGRRRKLHGSKRHAHDSIP